MSGDDPRHGTVQGYSRLGCRCHACRRAVNRYNKQRRLDEMRGLPSRYVSVVGTRRRLEALRALGWSMEQVAVRAGMDPGNLRRLVIKQSRVSRKVAARLAELYNQMSMTLPPERTQYERRSVRQARQAAFENGWPPPLAWDDIDHDDQPAGGWPYEPADRAELLEGLVERGAGITEATVAVGIARKSLETWCDRHGHRDLYQALAGREEAIRTFHNQWTKPRRVKETAA